MNTDIENIYEAFKGKLVGNDKMKYFVCETLSLMPKKVVQYVTKTCWFMGSMEDAWAFAFTGNDLKDQHLIFVSDHLLAQDEDQIRYSIAHEIGHITLGHRNSVLVKQTIKEIEKQEIEANQFAKRYLK